MQSPLSHIINGYQFQQIIAEYFRSLKSEKKDYQIEVYDNGKGPDGGFDILVEFIYTDVIGKHTMRWVVECKCWNEERSVGLDDIDTENVRSLLIAKKANGYLLICKGTVTNKLKDRFKMLMENDSNFKFDVWEGARVWHEISQRTSLMKAFFADFYREEFIDSRAKERYDKFVKEFEEKINKPE